MATHRQVAERSRGTDEPDGEAGPTKADQCYVKMISPPAAIS